MLWTHNNTKLGSEVNEDFFSRLMVMSHNSSPFDDLRWAGPPATDCSNCSQPRRSGRVHRGTPLKPFTCSEYAPDMSSKTCKMDATLMALSSDWSIWHWLQYAVIDSVLFVGR